LHLGRIVADKDYCPPTCTKIVDEAKTLVLRGQVADYQYFVHHQKVRFTVGANRHEFLMPARI
jgi:hypothetical protein